MMYCGEAEEEKISLEQAADLELILGECEEKYREVAFSTLKNQYKVHSLVDLPLTLYPRVKESALRNMNETYAKQTQQLEMVASQ